MTDDLPRCEHTAQTMLGPLQCLLWAGHDTDPATRSHSFLTGVSGGTQPEPRTDVEALAIIVGELWDDPPDDPPLTPGQFELHLREHYGADVAMVWGRLSVRSPEDSTWVLQPPGPT